VSDDLWREIEAAAGKPITAIAHDFTLQPGVPMIRVESAACSDGKTTLQLAQGEFTKDRPDKQPLSWRVPVIAQAIGGNAPVRAMVSDGHATLEVPGCGPVIVNAGQSGYYRTLYSPEQFSAISDSFAKLATIDQLGVMKDSWALGLAGLQPASNYLDLAKVAPVDADPQVWGDIADNLDTLDAWYRGDTARQAKLRAFAIARLAPVFARVGWDARKDEPAPVTVLRAKLLKTLGSLGDAAVIEQARHRYSAGDADAMPVELRKSILAVVASHADNATWVRLRAEAKAEKTPLVKDELYNLLATADDAALARRALELAITGEPGATNTAGMIRTVSETHPDAAFAYAVAHREQVDKVVDSTSRSRYYPYLGNNSLDPAMIGRIKAFADAHIAAGSRRAAETVMANIVYRIKVRDERLPEIDAWLAQNAG